jgi:hypothetical protein
MSRSLASLALLAMHEAGADGYALLTWTAQTGDLCRVTRQESHCRLLKIRKSLGDSFGRAKSWWHPIRCI